MLGCLGLIAAVIFIGVIAGGSKNHPALKWDFSGRAITTSRVGGADAFQITVTNNGPAATSRSVSSRSSWSVGSSSVGMGCGFMDGSSRDDGPRTARMMAGGEDISLETDDDATTADPLRDMKTRGALAEFGGDRN